MEWWLRLTRSPYLLLLYVLLGGTVGCVVVSVAQARKSAVTGIDAGRIHHMRFGNGSTSPKAGE